MSTELVRQTEAPLIVTRVGRPAELDRFPGGSRGRFALVAGGVLLALCGPDFILGARAPFLGQVLLAAALGAVPVALWNGWYWRRRWRMRRVVPWDGLGQPPSEATVRFAGTIEQIGTPFRLPESRGPLVYARTRFHEAAESKWAGAPSIEDIRAVPFQIRVNEQAAIYLSPELLRPLDKPERLRGNGDQHHQALGRLWSGHRLGPITRLALGPGDRVEVVGRLHREVAPQGQSAPGRGVPFMFVAGPAWDGAVWIRRLD